MHMTKIGSDLANRMAFAIFFLLLLTVTTQQATSTDTCVDLTAGVTGNGFQQYLFSGNQFTKYDPTLAMTEGNGGDGVHSVSEWTGMDPDAHITAGYMEPDSNDIIRLFAGNDVYLVDLNQNIVLEKTTVSSMFSKSENALLENGIQATTVFGNDRYFFSGCNVLKTDFNGNVAQYDLEEDLLLQCDVDSAFTYPRKDSNHLVITKGSNAYGWFLNTEPVAFGTILFCAADLLKGIAFNMCRVDCLDS